MKYNVRPFERDLDGIRWKLAHPSNRFTFFLGGGGLSLFSVWWRRGNFRCRLFNQQSTSLTFSEWTTARTRKRKQNGGLQYSKINQKRLLVRAKETRERDVCVTRNGPSCVGVALNTFFLSFLGTEKHSLGRLPARYHSTNSSIHMALFFSPQTSKKAKSKWEWTCRTEGESQRCVKSWRTLPETNTIKKNSNKNWAVCCNQMRNWNWFHPFQWASEKQLATLTLQRAYSYRSLPLSFNVKY